jgi:hypothetical protein
MEWTYILTEGFYFGTWARQKSISKNVIRKSVSKTKIDSPPLSEEEKADVKEARTEKGQIYDDVEDLIKDLHNE